MENKLRLLPFESSRIGVHYAIASWVMYSIFCVGNCIFALEQFNGLEWVQLSQIEQNIVLLRLSKSDVNLDILEKIDNISDRMIKNSPSTGCTSMCLQYMKANINITLNDGLLERINKKCKVSCETLYPESQCKLKKSQIISSILPTEENIDISEDSKTNIINLAKFFPIKIRVKVLNSEDGDQIISNSEVLNQISWLNLPRGKSTLSLVAAVEKNIILEIRAAAPGRASWASLNNVIIYRLHNKHGITACAISRKNSANIECQFFPNNLEGSVALAKYIKLIPQNDFLILTSIGEYDSHCTYQPFLKQLERCGGWKIHDFMTFLSSEKYSKTKSSENYSYCRSPRAFFGVSNSLRGSGIDSLAVYSRQFLFEAPQPQAEVVIRLVWSTATRQWEVFHSWTYNNDDLIRSMNIKSKTIWNPISERSKSNTYGYTEPEIQSAPRVWSDYMEHSTSLEWSQPHDGLLAERIIQTFAFLDEIKTAYINNKENSVDEVNTLKKESLEYLKTYKSLPKNEEIPRYKPALRRESEGSEPSVSLLEISQEINIDRSFRLLEEKRLFYLSFRQLQVEESEDEERVTESNSTKFTNTIELQKDVVRSLTDLLQKQYKNRKIEVDDPKILETMGIHSFYARINSPTNIINLLQGTFPDHEGWTAVDKNSLANRKYIYIRKCFNVCFRRRTVNTSILYWLSSETVEEIHSVQEMTRYQSNSIHPPNDFKDITNDSINESLEERYNALRLINKQALETLPKVEELPLDYGYNLIPSDYVEVVSLPIEDGILYGKTKSGTKITINNINFDKDRGDPETNRVLHNLTDISKRIRVLDLPSSETTSTSTESITQDNNTATNKSVSRLELPYHLKNLMYLINKKSYTHIMNLTAILNDTVYQSQSPQQYAFQNKKLLLPRRNIYDRSFDILEPDILYSEFQDDTNTSGCVRWNSRGIPLVKILPASALLAPYSKFVYPIRLPKLKIFPRTLLCYIGTLNKSWRFCNSKFIWIISPGLSIKLKKPCQDESGSTLKSKLCQEHYFNPLWRLNPYKKNRSEFMFLFQENKNDLSNYTWSTISPLKII